MKVALNDRNVSILLIAITLMAIFSVYFLPKIANRIYQISSLELAFIELHRSMKSYEKIHGVPAASIAELENEELFYSHDLSFLEKNVKNIVINFEATQKSSIVATAEINLGFGRWSVVQLTYEGKIKKFRN